MDWIIAVDSAVLIVQSLAWAFLALGAGLALNVVFPRAAPPPAHRSDAQHV
jgi:hypothetical protein